MEDSIKISVVLEAQDVTEFGQTLKTDLERGLNGAVATARQAAQRISSALRTAGEGLENTGRSFLSLTAVIAGLGGVAVKSAVDIDRQVNVLKSLTGSADAAEKRYAQLVATAQKTPGLTANLAATLDAQLRVANVAVKTIDQVLPAIGKLNAVSPLGNPQQFAANLTQLITQGFERADLKELVGNSPLAGELIKQIFGVDNATNAEAIRKSAKKLGIDTTDEFFAAFAEAARTNPKLANVSESLGAQFDKLRDRVTVALRPLGLAIIETLSPLVEKAVPIIERISTAFKEMPDSTRQAIVVFAAIAAAIGPVLIVIGNLVSSLGALGSVFSTIAGVVGSIGLGPLIAAIAGVVAQITIFYTAFQSNFGGIKDIAADAAKFIQDTFSDLIAFWKEIAPDLKAVIEPVLDAISQLIQIWSDLAKAQWGAYWQFFKTVVTEGLDVVKEVIRAALAFLRGDFEGFSASLRRIWIEAWDFLITTVTRALVGVGDTISAAFRALLNLVGQITGIGASLGDAFVSGLRGALDAFFPGASKTLGGFVNSVRGFLNQKDNARNQARVAREARGGLDGEEITAADFAKNNEAIAQQIADQRNKARQSAAAKSGNGGGDAAAKARQLREAQLRFEKETLEQQLRLVEDANNRELRSIQALYDDAKISLREYYDAKLGLQQANVGNSINLLQTEIRATEESLKTAKAGTPEKIRLESELLRLRTDLTLKTKALTDLEIENQREYLKAATETRNKLLAETQKLGLKVDENNLPTNQIAPNVSAVQQQAQERLRQLRELQRQANLADLQVQQQELAIQQAVTLGVISEAEGKERTLELQRQLRDVLIQSLEAQRANETDPEVIARLNLEIQKLATLGAQLSPAQAFFKGLKSQAETTAEAFERIGTAFKDKFLGLVDSGIDKITRKFGFLKDLIGDILKSLTRRIFSQLLGGGGGGGLLGGNGNAGGSAGGGFSLGGLFGGLFGGGGNSGGGGLLGGLFNRGGSSSVPFVGTGGFAGGNPLGQLLGGGGAFNLPLLGGLGLSTPPSISASGLSSVFGSTNSGGGTGGLSGLRNLFSGGAGGLFQGIGFGKSPGSGGALAQALPLLGLSFGAQLGGGSGLGAILGGAGGALLGIGATAAPAFLSTGVFASGGALGGFGSAATALFSNPFTIAAGAALLIGGFLFGRARQRRKDEATSGDYLQEAVDAIFEIRDQVKNDQVQLTAEQAKQLFRNDVLNPFIAQINTIKTKSVRESRLKNQTKDLENLFTKEVLPAIEEQAKRIKAGTFGGRDIKAEFAIGGVVPGISTGRDTVAAWLTPGEIVMNARQQRALVSLTGASNIFQLAGVPGAGLVPAPTIQPSQQFAQGGVVAPQFIPTGGSSEPVQITVIVNNGMSEEEAAAVVETGVKGSRGRNAIARAFKAERRFGAIS